MELLSLGMFCAALLLSIIFDFSILYALAAGLVIFLLYGRKKGCSWPALGRMLLDGVLTVKNILITFLLIGMLTAVWRASGTIAVIVCYATRLIRPSVFLLMVFLLNCGVSVLTGTSFGTAATMGVICATMATAMQLSPILVGGAVLAGAFFGDRCSPVSTSALLVSALTGTNIFDNIKRMLRTALVPFLLACGIYLTVGLCTRHNGALLDLQSLMGREFRLHWIALLPAVVVLALSVMRVNVKITMGVSILTALPICLLVQHTDILELLRLLLLGFQAKDQAVSVMVNGGGVVSMLRVGCIVCLSSSFSGIFQKTGLLDGIKAAVARFAGKTTPFLAILCTSVVAAMIACNQTLAIILTDQLCGDLGQDKATLAINLEDTAVVVSPLVPWSIACGVPLAAVGAPAASVLLAVYLWLLPLWRLLGSVRERRKAAKLQPSHHFS